LLQLNTNEELARNKSGIFDVAKPLKFRNYRFQERNQ
jgi:hypothetical protein